MTRRVAIVGLAQSKHSAPFTSQETVRALVYDVTKDALEDAGITKDDVETVVSSSSDFWQGMGCSNVFHFESAAAYMKDSPKVEEDSAQAFFYACMRILSGHFDTAVVATVTKGSECPSISALTNLYCEPFYQRATGLEEISAAALQAQIYMNKYGVGEEQIAQVSVKNHRNALSNPNAHRKMNLRLDDVLESKLLASPLRELECSPSSDGACVVILAEEEKARMITDNPVWVEGVGWSAENYFLGDRDLINPLALKAAAKMAYGMACIEHPRKEIDVAELCEPYAHQELLWCEGLGFCKEGEGAKLLADGATDMKGDLPINPSGGVLATNPFVPRGLIRIAEASLQVMGRGGRHQVPGVERALAHSTHGLGGQIHSVVVLGR